MGGQMWMLHKMWASGVTMPSKVGGNEEPVLRAEPEQPVNS